MASGGDVPDFIVDLMSPQSSVDSSTRDRMVVQQELERKLRTRADREHLVQKNILPDLSTSPVLYTQTQQLQRAKNADNLQKKLRNRPERQDLMQMNILPDLQINIDPGLQSKQMQLKKSKLADTLNRKLASRPGPLELIQGRILEPKNAELAEMVRSVFESSVDGEKGEASGSLGGSPNSADKDSGASRRHSGSVLSPQVELSPPSKDLASPMQEGDRAGRKYSDSSSPAHSPGDAADEISSPTKGLMSPPSQFTQSFPPGGIQGPLRATQTPGILSSGGKCLSPSQVRKKQQKQKYRKLRYHEYVPPSKNNGKGGKTNPKPHSKQETPYNLILQQQQLFLQLQVLQQQYPNGVLMQKLPDIVDSLSKSGKLGKGKATSPSGTSAAGTSTSAPVSVPQVVPVEQPNRFQMTSIRFEELKVSDLKGACKEMGMIVSGKKAELVERLLEHNNGVLPVFALPESQAKEAQRSQQQFARPMHPPLLESQVSAPTLSPPSPTSPIFKFPEDQNGIRNQVDMGGANGSARKSSLSGLSSMGAPQVIPAAKLRQQFDELVERQKLSYVCLGQAPKSLAPRPELGDMVAIKFPCPVDTPLRDAQPHPQAQLPQQQLRSSKGLTLPRQSSDSKMVMSPYNKQSHSLPSSPKPLSPANSTSHLLGELMEDSSSESQSLESSLQMPCSGGPTVTSTIGGGITPPPNSQTFPSSTPSSSSVSTSTTGLPHTGSYTHSNHHGPMMATGSYYQQAKQPLRPSHSIPLGGILPSKMHPPNPPPPYGSTNSAMMHRSMSLTSPYPHNMPHHRLHSAASFGSDNSDLITPPELHKPSMEGFMFHDELGGQHTNPMEMPLETQMDTSETSQLSEIFSILEDTGGFAVPGQPPSYSSKLSNRQDSIRSESIMLASGLAYPTPNPPLSHQHKSNSDVCLLDSHKHTVNPPPYNCSGAMLGGGMGWLDQQEGGMLSEVSPVGNLSMSHSNPGSLPHEGFQMNFLDDLGVHKQNTSSANMNGFSHGETFLTHNLPTSSGLLFSAPDESQALLELGLSTS